MKRTILLACKALYFRIFIFFCKRRVLDLNQLAIFKLYISKPHKMNGLHQEKGALKVPTCGNNITFCGKSSENLLQHPDF